MPGTLLSWACATEMIQTVSVASSPASDICRKTARQTIITTDSVMDPLHNDSDPGNEEGPFQNFEFDIGLPAAAF
jgi:hypothetical protein